jgi:hypothetical protein
MARSEARGAWEFVPPNAFRAAWPPLRNAVLGGPAADCGADWARRRVCAWLVLRLASAHRAVCDACQTYARTRCAAALRRRILVEVQANSNYRLFMDEVLPYAAQLRQRYARCNCTSALSILLRCAALRVWRAVRACALCCCADSARVLLGVLCFIAASRLRKR